MSRNGPGPGTYSPNAEVVLKKAAAPGMGYGKKTPIANPDKLPKPGPGEYPMKNIRGEGPKYKFGSSSRDRKVNGTPGPGQYEVKSMISDLPSYEKTKMK